jgi:RHS repeat-associated protein
MTYHYAKPLLKSLCLTEIRFSANTITNTTPLNKIVFTYKNATRKEQGYLKGELIEKVELLSKVEVFTNNLLFRRYQITHKTDALGYDRVERLQEFNGLGEPANPIVFTYNESSGATIENNYFPSNIAHELNPNFTGDFDGDGRLDFVVDNKVYFKLYEGGQTQTTLPFTTNTRNYFPATVMQYYDNKLYQRNSIINAMETPGKIEFNALTFVSTNGTVTHLAKSISINNQYTVSEEYVDYSGTAPTNNNCDYSQSQIAKIEYLEGDFNGDGISEVLFSRRKNEHRHFVHGTYEDNHNQEPIITYSCEMTVTDEGVESFWVDFNTATSNLIDSNGFQKLNINVFQDGFKRFAMDFNSDGKTDILLINTSNNSYNIYSFVNSTTAPFVALEIIGQGVIDEYATDKQILFGDFNGDSKPDIMLPDVGGEGCDGCNLWHIYYSNPRTDNGNFFVKNSMNIMEYRPFTGDSYETFWISQKYFAIDINKDGKSDLVRFQTDKYQPSWFYDPKDIDTKWWTNIYINNLGLNNTFTHVYQSPWYHDSDYRDYAIPIVGDYKHNGVNKDMLVIWGDSYFDKRITYIDYKKDFIIDNQLKEVSQSNGAIVDRVFYKSLDQDGTGFYYATNSLNYPFLELERIPSSQVVSQIHNITLGVTRKQDFVYGGLSIKMDGLGMIGFQFTRRSSWYINENDTKIWSSKSNNVLQRGATVDENNYLFKNDNYTPISKKTNVFNTATDPITKRFTILLQSQTQKDFLTNVVKQKTFNTYSTDYYLPTQTTDETLLNGVVQSRTISNTVFENNVTGTGANYYIGRPKETTTTTTLFVNTLNGQPDTKTSNEKTFYFNGNVLRTEKKANNSAETLIETFEYFTNSLLKKRTLTATGVTDPLEQIAPRSTSYTYDPTNRFVKTITDTEGLVTTNLTYHDRYGTVLSQRNHLNQTTSTLIDNWGKQTEVKDFLNKKITYSYTRSAQNEFTTTQTGDDGSMSSNTKDVLGREIKVGSRNLNNLWSYINTEYDHLSRKFKVSEPFYSTPTQWNTITYDDYNRPIINTSYTGKSIYTTYNGLSVTVNDNVMSKTKTMNAVGLNITAIDNPGGTINYKYDANGNLLESDYDGIKITMQYDNWGKKTYLHDTSAGTYTYKYNILGEIIKETTPKGQTTYTLNNVGKVISKKILGDGVDMTTNYTYDATKKWLTNMQVINPIDGNSTYIYTYDTTGTAPTQQLKKTEERLHLPGQTTPYAVFVKDLTFDTFGRVNTENSTASAHDKSSSKTITHQYKNGVKYRILDGTAIKWELNQVNEKGQLTSATFGNGIETANSYDAFGFYKQFKHTKAGNTVMQLDFTFDPVLGNLQKRYSSLYGIEEKFGYDQQDRLVTTEFLGGIFQEYQFETASNDNFGFEPYNLQPLQEIVVLGGKLSVTTNYQSGTQKHLGTNLMGKKFKINFNVFKNPGDNVIFRIVEKDPSGDVLNDIVTDYNHINNVEYLVETNNPIYLVWEIVNIPVNPIDVNDPIGIFQPRLANRDRFIDILDPNDPIEIDPNDPIDPVAPDKVFYLDNIVIRNIVIERQDYDNRGRITENKIGSYNYTVPNKPYQNSTIDVSNAVYTTYQNLGKLDISYNTFKAPIYIELEGKERIDFGYNTNHQRTVMYYGDANANKFNRKYRRYYSADGSMEIRHEPSANKVEFITYIDGTAYSSNLIVKSDGITQNYVYLHRDYQGTILALTNDAGVLVEKRHFDAWGELKQVHDGAGNALAKLTILDRGYTGHEHLQTVGLIHMNGRLYDPAIHRFLQPDNYVQDPYNTQNYNRYGYCYNNPLKYTDPSGEELVSAIAWGAGIALASYFLTSIMTDQPLTLMGALKSIAIGAISGAVTFGIGELFNGVGTFALKATYQALAHGTFQGLVSGVQGGGFWTGFAAGAISSMASSLYQGVGHDNAGWHGIGGCGATGETGMIIFGTVMGGASATLTGGNFWQGAATGLMVSALNHAQKHGGDLDDDVKINTEKKTVEVTRTNDSGDRIFVDGVEVMGTPKGFMNDILIDDGYSFSMKGPQPVGMALTDFALSIFGTKGAFSFLGNATNISQKSAQFVIRHSNFFNKGNWWRLGYGYNPTTALKNLRLAWGAHPKHLNEVPKILQPLNKYIRNIGGGHKHFENWKPN